MRRLIRRPVPNLHPAPPARLSLALLCAGALLLAACAAPRARPTGASAQPPLPASAAALFQPAPDGAPGYRVDAARHLYGQNRDRIYAGRLPHYLRAVGVLETQVDAQGHVTALRWLRAPTHAPEVMAEIESLVRQAAPFPAPAAAALQGGSARVIETWLWDRSGRFQLRTLSEGQGDSAPSAGPAQLATRGAAPLGTTAAPPAAWQPVRVHVVAADGR